jgi:hypothetical protein
MWDRSSGSLEKESGARWRAHQNLDLASRPLILCGVPLNRPEPG